MAFLYEDSVNNHSRRPLSYKHDTKLLVLALEKLKEAYSVKGDHLMFDYKPPFANRFNQAV
jgi:hypothetical protein